MREGVSAALAAMVVCALAGPIAAQEGVLLADDQAPRAVFPDGDRFERSTINATDTLRERMKATLGNTAVSVWEPEYVTFRVWRGTTEIGRAFLVEEVGKHRPITFVVGIRPDGHVQDVAVVAYREAYGGEIRNRRFLVQYKGKSATDSLQPFDAITNIAGATLSVDAASRAVKKTLALAAATQDEPADTSK